MRKSHYKPRQARYLSAIVILINHCYEAQDEPQGHENACIDEHILDVLLA